MTSYAEGTHRLVPPEETLGRITPLLPRMGITRCLDITGLDSLGVPVYCATRPRGLVLQTSAGKGQTRTAAKVSALMEAAELYHAENPPPLRCASMRELENQGWRVVEPTRIDGFTGKYFSPDFRVSWVKAESLSDSAQVQIPAGAIYFIEPTLHVCNTNGLASGNSLEEASLHALYELIERDDVARISEDGRLQIRKYCQSLDLQTLPDSPLLKIIRRVEAAKTKVVLLKIPSRLPVYTFWAIFLNQAPFHAVSTISFGYGTHASAEIAASRAVTEAAQCRASCIHGSREDVLQRPVQNLGDATQSAAYRYFDALPRDSAWNEPANQLGSIGQTFATLIEALRAAGFPEIYRCDLTHPGIGIPVVKIIIPGMQIARKLL